LYINYKRELLIHENNRGDDYSYISQKSGIVDTPTTNQLGLVLVTEYLLFRCSVGVFLSTQIGCKRRKQYASEALKMAIAMVRSGQMSKNGAAKKYGVSRTTLF